MRELLGHDPEGFEAERFSYQVIADHSRAVTFLVGDGVLPVERGPRLRPAPDPAARGAPRAPARPDRAVHGRDGEGRHRHDGRTRTRTSPSAGRRSSGVIEREERQFNRTLEAGTGLLEEALIPLTSAERVVGRQAETLPPDAPVLPGDGRVQAPRHVRVPDRPDGRARGRVRRADGPRRVRGRARRAADAQPGGHEGGPREDRRARVALQRAARAGLGADRVPGLRHDDRRGARRRRSCATASSTRRSRRCPRSSSGPTRPRAPSSSSTGRRSTPRAAARSPTPGTSDPRTAACCSTVDDVQRVAGTQTAGPHRPSRGAPRQGRRRATRCRSRSMPTGAPTRCATTRARTCCTARCATSSANQARQAGSLVHPDYLRFDYPFDRALTDDEKHAIEAEVRGIVRDDRPVSIEWMTMAEAQAAGADAFFDEKYGDKVRTIRVEGFSHELCGGTHCRASGQVGNFVITGERSIGSGVRRIEAVTGAARRPADGRAVRDARSGGRRGRGPDAGGARGADRRAPGRAARDEAPAARGRRGRPAQARRPRRDAPRRSAPGMRFIGAALDLESIDALKGFAQGPARRLPVGRDRARASTPRSRSCSSPSATTSSRVASRPGRSSRGP